MRGILVGEFTGTGQSEVVYCGPGLFNVSVLGGSGTIDIERSFDDGTTWRLVKRLTGDYEGAGYEPEFGTVYRFNCTAYTSGPIGYRIGSRQA